MVSVSFHVELKANKANCILYSQYDVDQCKMCILVHTFDGVFMSMQAVYGVSTISYMCVYMRHARPLKRYRNNLWQKKNYLNRLFSFWTIAKNGCTHDTRHAFKIPVVIEARKK